MPEGVLGEGREIDAMSEQTGRTVSLGDRPEAVVAAIRGVVTAVREAAGARQDREIVDVLAEDQR
jgi:hypothetical protein